MDRDGTAGGKLPNSGCIVRVESAELAHRPSVGGRQASRASLRLGVLGTSVKKGVSRADGHVGSEL